VDVEREVLSASKQQVAMKGIFSIFSLHFMQFFIIIPQFFSLLFRCSMFILLFFGCSNKRRRTEGKIIKEVR
jgi:hypothetical protein